MHPDNARTPNIPGRERTEQKGCGRARVSRERTELLTSNLKGCWWNCTTPRQGTGSTRRASSPPHLALCAPRVTEAVRERTPPKECGLRDDLTCHPRAMHELGMPVSWGQLGSAVVPRAHLSPALPCPAWSMGTFPASEPQCQRSPTNAALWQENEPRDSQFHRIGKGFRKLFV